MDKLTGIYKITNPRGKIYIGQSIDIKTRWKTYYGMHKGSMGRKLYNSLKKYGPNNHIFEIIEQCDVNELILRETYYKKLYNSVVTGLNLKIDDDRYGPHTQETKNLISEQCIAAAKNRVYTPEWKRKMQLAKTGHACYKNPERNKKIGLAHKNKIMSDETRSKLYTEDWYHKVRENNKKNNKPVEQYDLSGNLIKTYDSISDARNETGINSISNNLTGNTKTAGGYIWKYKDRK